MEVLLTSAAPTGTPGEGEAAGLDFEPVDGPGCVQCRHRIRQLCGDSTALEARVLGAQAEGVLVDGVDQAALRDVVV